MLLLAAIAVVRVISNYSQVSQAFDEPYHVAAAMEFLDKGTYALDPLHPPLQRIAIGVPLYLAGVRYPDFSQSELNALPEPHLCAIGNAILNRGGHSFRNLALARLGIIPFLVLASAVVFFWARQECGDFAGVAAAALFTTLPIVLAFSEIAYTDMVAASTQTAAFWAFAMWLENRNWRTTAWMGIAVGMALLAKFTSWIYFPAAVLSVVVLRWVVQKSDNVSPLFGYRRTARQVLLAATIAIAMVWAGYGFATGHVRESMHLSAESMPSFQHFPSPLASIGRKLILADPRVPAPALVRGLASVWVMEKTEPAGYLLGHIKQGGWWYFFLIGIAVKSPVPFLILLVAGLVACKRWLKEGHWTAMAPPACALAILIVTLPVKINYGIRHVLVVFPLMSIVAGYGCSYLWHLRGRQRLWGRSALAVLLLWQGVSTVRAGSDLIAYFNEFAGKDPSRILVAGCDLDCGQDLFRLSRELQQRNVSHVSLALWDSADLSTIGLPEFAVPQPYQPVTGWFAISLRALRAGDVFHSTYPPDAFAWLSRYQPVKRVGKTILLYHIAEPMGVAGSDKP